MQETRPDIAESGERASRKARSSQFELLRIAAMTLVVLGHLVLKGADTVGFGSGYDPERDGRMGVLLYSLAVVGVDLFVMITGWFGVRRIYGKAVRLVVDVAVYGLLTYLLFALLPFGGEGGQVSLVAMVKQMSITSNWFVTHYIILLLVAPILEKALDGAGRKEVGIWVALLTVVNVVFGYVLGRIDSSGYSAMNFVWLYFVARWMRLSQETRAYGLFSRHGVWVWLVLGVALSVGFEVAMQSGVVKDTIRWFSYSNPLVVLSSAALFAWFSQLKVSSAVVNRLASGMFGVYLLHTATNGLELRNAFTQQVYQAGGYGLLFLETVLIVVVCCAVSLLLNKATVWLTGKIVSLSGRLASL